LRGVPLVGFIGLEDRIRLAAPDGVTAFIDLHGPEYVRLVVRLGVPRDRINTVVAFEAAGEPGTKAESSMAGTPAAALAADGNIREGPGCSRGTRATPHRAKSC
jgi:NADPH2:quinone reductase